jgi:hypothetical protein
MLDGTGPHDFERKFRAWPEIDREELGMKNTNNIREYPDYNHIIIYSQQLYICNILYIYII